MKFMGYRVVEKPEQIALASAVGLWPFRRLWVSEAFRYYLAHEQKAVLLHEVGHIKGFHVERRLLGADPLALELEADAYAASFGYGYILANVLERRMGIVNPQTQQRIARLRAQNIA